LNEKLGYTMFVLIVSRGYPTPDNPLMGIFETDQAKALQSYGHRVILVSVDLRSLRRKRKLGFQHFFSDGLEIYNFSFPLGRVPKRLLLYAGIFSIRKLYSQIIQQYGSPDMIHAHFTEIAAIASSLKEKYNIPLIVTEHSSLMNKDKISTTSFFWGEKAYHHANKIICVSSALSEKVKKHFGKDSIIVPNIVDTTIFSSVRKKNNRFIFISVGSLICRKGFDVLINAFSSGHFDENVSLYIVGEGSCRNHLEKQIRILNLEKQVKLFGVLSRQQIQELFSISSVFILTSRLETFGVVYIEAMSAGLPVVATRCEGPEDFVDEANGLLVDVEDMEGTATAMKYMYRNIDRYNGEKISAETKKHFAPDMIARQLTEIYQSI
jgi:glycosyltransferase involved in cell wall biosynthesis